jgi:diacylglycerol O-acyltransferase / wax synthase
MSKAIPALDLMFLLTETPDSPKHVGAAMTFKLPPGGGPRIVREIVDAYRSAKPVAPFTYVPQFSVKSLPRWRVAPAMDMDYHVQHLALPPDAGHEQFLKLVEALHEPVLDRNRPGFRVHLIEGLPENGSPRCARWARRSGAR